MRDTFKGSCLCGAVAYEVKAPVTSFQYCHCSRCRKVSGTAHASNILVKAEQLSWTQGEQQLARFELPEAKAFASCFCKVCGSSLPWVTKNGRWVVVPAGTLDEDPGITPQRSIFWGSRSPWYHAVNELDCFETVPPRQ